MRGFPPIHLVLLAFAFAWVAVPLARMTGQGAHVSGLKSGSDRAVLGPDDHPEEDHAHRLNTQIHLRFAHRPEKVSLTDGELDLLSDAVWDDGSVSAEVALEIGHDGEEFLLSATWPDGTPPTAMTVRLEPEGLDVRQETRWSEAGTISDILVFHW